MAQTTPTAAQGIVQVNLASESYKHLLRLLELGALQGTLGALTINPSVRPLVDALYEVLAGGSVTVTASWSSSASGTLTITAGVPQTVTELKNLETDGLVQLNEINAKAGFGLVIAL
jgi:hypothetical protein